MTKKPLTIEELEADILNHPNRGKINGIEVCEISNSPLNCEINGTVYNQLILLRGALGYTKSQVATSAMKDFLVNLILNKKNKTFITDVVVEGRSLFRGQVPSWIYSRCIFLGKEHGLSVRQVCTAALTKYANKPENLFLIDEFLHSKSLLLNCSEDDIKNAIYGFSKKVSRRERLKRLRAGQDVDAKMDV